MSRRNTSMQQSHLIPLHVQRSYRKLPTLLSQNFTEGSCNGACKLQWICSLFTCCESFIIIQAPRLVAMVGRFTGQQRLIAQKCLWLWAMADLTHMHMLDEQCTSYWNCTHATTCWPKKLKIADFRQQRLILF